MRASSPRPPVLTLRANYIHIWGITLAIPSLLAAAGSETLKGRRANYFPARSSGRIEFRDGGERVVDVDDESEDEIPLCADDVKCGPLRRAYVSVGALISHPSVTSNE